MSIVREGARAHLDYGRKKAVVARVEGYSARFTYETRANILRLKRLMDIWKSRFLSCFHPKFVLCRFLIIFPWLSGGVLVRR